MHVHKEDSTRTAMANFEFKQEARLRIISEYMHCGTLPGEGKFFDETSSEEVVRETASDGD